MKHEKLAEAGAKLEFPDFDSNDSQGRSSLDTLQYLAPNGEDRETSLAMCEGVLDILSALFSVSGRQLRSSKRTTKPIARIRQIGMYVANTSLGIGMTMVGEGFGRNKSTVIHACYLIEDMRDDEDFDRIVMRVEKIVCTAFNVARASTFKQWR